MRLLVLKADNLSALNARLQASTAGDPLSIDRLRVLNPQIDFSKKLEPGAVLFLPDTPSLDASSLDTPGSSTLDGGAFDAFASDVGSGFKASTARARAGFERLNADRTEVAAVLKTAAVKRLVESDPVLKAQVDDAGTQFAKDQRDAADVAKQLDAMQKDVAAEMAALGKLFG